MLPPSITAFPLRSIIYPTSIPLGVPSCSIHWSWCSIMSQVIDCNVPSCSIHPLIMMFQPTAANSAESLDSLPHSDCESLQPELEEVKPEVRRADDYIYNVKIIRLNQYKENWPLRKRNDVEPRGVIWASRESWKWVEAAAEDISFQWLGPQWGHCAMCTALSNKVIVGFPYWLYQDVTSRRKWGGEPDYKVTLQSSHNAQRGKKWAIGMFWVNWGWS